MTDIVLIAGARPNFMKIAPLIHAIQAHNTASNSLVKISYKLIHTGQHYDERMSQLFFDELNIPHPNVNLGCGGGSQAQQAAAIMVAFENYLADNPCKLVLVVGDVTSTLACSIVAKKMNTRVAHVEAGIRSFDLTMPEEINRMVTDSITDYFFTTSTYANENLKNAGIKEERIFYCGNVMIDTLRKNEPRFCEPDFFNELGLKNGNYLVLTLHRPSNVDNREMLQKLLSTVDASALGSPVIFPVHPRTQAIMDKMDIRFSSIQTVPPQGYLNFMYLVKNAMGVVTDSGGITEEATVMNIPCMTLRYNTERPETTEIGTNILVGQDLDAIAVGIQKMVKKDWKSGSIPYLWDGRAAERIVNSLIQVL